MGQRQLGRPRLGWAIACVISLITLSSCTRQPPTTTAPNADQSTTTPGKLDQILAKGSLICGVNGQLPGFSYVNDQGEYSGLDVDFCRAIAAALFDDPNAVQFRDLNAQERIAALQSNQIDLLSRNTTVTLSRDSGDRLEFAPILFYDGQGILVAQASGIRTLNDLEGKSICVQANTTTELNLADQMRQRRITYKPVVFDNPDAMYAAYAQGRCEGATSDRSQLLVQRETMANPKAHILLPDILSKEPLAPAITDDDARWLDTVKWVAYTLIEAEELGITSQNLADFLESKDPQVRRFLGSEGNFGETLGLPNDFAARIIKHVGNYGEIYDRNLGQPFGLERGLNDLWTNGGLLYAPPFR